VLANAHGDDLATTALACGAWENDPAWQPLRRACEQLLVTRDWGGAFAARNLAIKPALDALLDSSLADPARRNSDEFLALLFTEFGADAQRSHDIRRPAGVQFDTRRVGLVIRTGQVRAGTPSRAGGGADGLAGDLAAPGVRGGRVPRPAFTSAPAAMAPGEVVGAARKQHHPYLERCGLVAG